MNSQITDSIGQNVKNIKKFEVDSSIILNNDTIKDEINNSISFINILPTRGKVVSYCDGIKIWKLNDGKFDTLIRIGNDELIKDLLVTKDESRVIVSVSSTEMEDYVSCYSLSDYRMLWRTGNLNFENGLCLSTNDSIVIAAGSWEITVIDAISGKIRTQKRSFMKKYFLPNAGGIAVQFSPTGRYVLYWNDPKLRNINLGFGSKLNVWDLSKNKSAAVYKVPKFRVWNATFLPDEKNILIGSNKGIIKLWSFKENAIVDTWGANINFYKKGKKEISEVDKIIIPKRSARYLGIYGKYYSNWALKIFSYPDMKLLRVVLNPDFTDMNWPSSFSNDGDYFIVSDKGYLKLYCTEDWRHLWSVPIRKILKVQN